MTVEERDLIISFVTEQLRPIMVGGELKSYQIELVEQVGNLFEGYAPHINWKCIALLSIVR